MSKSILVSSVSLLFLAIAKIAQAFPAEGGLDHVCYKIFSVDQRVTTPPSPIEVNACIERRKKISRKCMFDTSSCEFPCRFGHVVSENNCPVSCDCALEGLFEGDIKFSTEDLALMMEAYEEPPQGKPQAASSSIPRWDENRKNGRVLVPYSFDKELSTEARAAVMLAIESYSEHTCIDFVKRAKEKDHLVFKSKSGCWSYVGRRGGPQTISIGQGCEWAGVVAHELLHALGFWHEQSRPDRDDYVTIEYDNIQSNMEHNFQKRQDIDSLGSEYDTKSLMHYGGYDFTTNSQPTIIDKATGQPVNAQREGLSKSDIYQVRKMYKCGEEIQEQANWASWGSWSPCSHTCGMGQKTRSRLCMRGKGVVSFKECKWLPIEQQYCKIVDCAQHSWSAWTEWSECKAATCDNGYQLRTRECKGADTTCKGSKWDARGCEADDCESADRDPSEDA